MICEKCGNKILESEKIPGMKSGLCFKHNVLDLKKTSGIKKQICLNWFESFFLFKKVFPKKVYR
jgi:hypothetical protein